MDTATQKLLKPAWEMMAAAREGLTAYLEHLTATSVYVGFAPSDDGRLVVAADIYTKSYVKTKAALQDQHPEWVSDCPFIRLPETVSLTMADGAEAALLLPQLLAGAEIRILIHETATGQNY